MVDPSFSFIHNPKYLSGMCVTYVDDMVHIGTEEYFDFCKPIGKIFQCQGLIYYISCYKGLEVQSLELKSIIYLKRYTKKT